MEVPNEANREQKRLGDIKDLEDANDAGKENSQSCTLILTDGHAAKSLAIAGLSVIHNGRDTYGVYPLERRLINVSKKTREEVEKNEVVLQLVAILGLRFNGSYRTIEDLRSLRYGHVMLMMNRDEDGSHKKGLLINLFRRHWPTLFRNGFIQQFITPVVKVCYRKGSRSFYSYQEFKRYCSVNLSFEVYSIVHHRSLESFTSSEIKDYFSHMDDHCVQFTYSSKEDDDSFDVSFEEGFEDKRKNWLKEPPQEPLIYSAGMRNIAYKDFIHKELKFYSKLHNVRSFRSIIDGLTRSERNVLHACFEKWADQEVNVLTLIHSVLEDLAYKQSTESVGQTIINMAQDFAGKNNINVLKPLGQFGTRLRGGKDAGKVEHLRTKLQDFTKLLFSVSDNTLFPKDRKILDISTEPWNYFPIIPMILVNGCSGIGTGFKTKILSYNPKDIIENIYRLMKGKKQKGMTPWFRGFGGKVEEIGSNEFRVYGDVSKLKDNQISITELPIRVLPHDYKRKTLDPMLKDLNRIPRLISYTEHHTDASIHFRVTLADIPDNYGKEDFLEYFKLHKDLTDTLVAFDSDNSEKKYDNVTDILKEFYDIRLAKYVSTRLGQITNLTHRLEHLTNQRRKIKQEIIIEDSEKSERITIKREYLYEEDNIKTEEGSHNTSSIPENSTFLSNVWYGMERHIRGLEEEISCRQTELQELERSTAVDLWKKDLEKLCSKLGIAPVTITEDDDEKELKGNTHSNHNPQLSTAACSKTTTNTSNSVRGPKTSTPKRAAVKNMREHDISPVFPETATKDLKKSSKGRQKDKKNKNSEDCERENGEHNITKDDNSESEDIRNGLETLRISPES